MNIPNESITILVADDVFTNIEFLRYILRKEKYQILPVNNGREALDAVANNTIDIILLDVMMPEMDGFEVCRQLKEDEATKDIPIIFLTARTDIESTVKGFELGAVDYVTKPFHRQELLARVRSHIELQKAKQSYLNASNSVTSVLQQVADKSGRILSELDRDTPDLGLIKLLATELQRTKQ